MKVVIIGTGNVATVLGKKIAATGNEIVQVIGRSLVPTKQLGSSLNSTASTNLSDINTSADIYIIAVSDSAIAGIASQLKLKNKFVVHTAGGVSKEVLKDVSSNYGVLYPLQSLRKEMINLPEIPVIVDGNTQLVRDALITFAFPWAKNVEQCDDEQRLKLHIAGVMASNFTNHLFALAEKYCEDEGLNFKMLFPLIKETVLRIERNSPARVQTGPAVRGDTETVNKHRELLKKYPKLEDLYNVLTESIIGFKKNDT